MRAILAVMLLAMTAHADTQIAAHAPVPEAKLVSPKTQKLRVCFLPYGEVAPSQARFEQLYAPVRTIESTRELAECQLVVVASDWYDKRGDMHDRMWPSVEGWVRRGGALLVFQPNPFSTGTAKIELFDTWFRVANDYVNGEGAVKLATHPILANLADKDLSFPADQITGYDQKQWTALVGGSQSQSASLLVGSFGSGRVAIDTDNPARQVESLAGHSNAFLRSVVGWLTSTQTKRAR